MKNRCKNIQDKECLCRKMGWTKWLYIIPIALCAIFSMAFLEVENYYQGRAWDVLAEDNHKVFDALYNISTNSVPTYEVESGQRVSKFYHDSIVPTISNTDFTFGYPYNSTDSLPILVNESIGQFTDSTLSTVINTRVAGLGLTRIWRYKFNDSNYWVFGTYDSGLVDDQRNGLAIIIFLSLFSTAILNLIIIYKINQTIHGATIK